VVPSDYVLFCKDRPSCGGGVLLAIENDIPCQLVASPNNVEMVCVSLNYSYPILCCLIYIPPNSSTIYCQNLLDFLSNITFEHNVQLGDFNFPDIDWNTLSGVFSISCQFCDFVFAPDLC